MAISTGSWLRPLRCVWAIRWPPRRSAIREKFGLERLGCGQHFLDMARHLDLAPYVANRPLGVDQEGRPLDPHVFSSIHAFLDPGAVGSADLAVLVGGELKGQVVFLLELVVAGHVVAA